MKRLGLLFLMGALTLGASQLKALEEQEQVGPEVEALEVLDELLDEGEHPGVQEQVKNDLFLALQAYGFDQEFLKGKEVVIVEKEDGEYVPRYVSHKHKSDPFFMMENGVMAASSIVTFVLTMPLFYKLFHSSTYKEALGDIFALVCSLVSSGGVSYLSGALANEIYKNASAPKVQN